MPNWCTNRIDIEGPVNQVKSFMEIVNEDLDGSTPRIVNFMPMPEMLEGTTSPSPKSEVFDEDGRLMGYVNDPDNSNWDMDLYEKRKAEHAVAWEKTKVVLAETGYTDWYSWANSDTNWGTKWGDCQTYFDEPYEGKESAFVSGGFETAWGPLSQNFWLTVSRTLPDLQIVVSYTEEGMCFEGAMSFKGGECFYDECTETTAHHGQAYSALQDA